MIYPVIIIRLPGKLCFDKFTGSICFAQRTTTETFEHLPAERKKPRAKGTARPFTSSRSSSWRGL